MSVNDDAAADLFYKDYTLAGLAWAEEPRRAVEEPHYKRTFGSFGGELRVE